MTACKDDPDMLTPDQIMGLRERAKLLLLGTFHFQSAGLDALNTQVDMTTPRRQAEIDEVVGLLAAFRPTKVAVEAQLERDAVLQERYQAYLSGAFDLPANEIYQLGFRVAARCGHGKVFPIDAWDRHYETEEQFLAYAKARGFSEEAADDLLREPQRWERYKSLYRQTEEIIASRPLRESLAYLNGAEHVRVTHGLDLAWPDAEPGDYTAVDFRTGWFNRNLRIFANLKRMTESPEDRILVVYGAGHLALLQQLVQASYLHELVDVQEYLRGR